MSTKILIVDDEESFTELLAVILADEGFEVTTAPSGNRAWEIFQGGAIDLIVSDINMPNGDGIELLERVKGLSPDTPFVLFMTGISPVSEDEAREAGANGILAKPVEVDDLLQVIGKCLHQKEQMTLRRHIRVRGEVSVSIQFEGSDVTETYDTDNIGRGGAFICVDDEARQPTIGDKLSVSVALDGEVQSCPAVVRWLRNQGGPVGFGVSFIKPTREFIHYINLSIINIRFCELVRKPVERERPMALIVDDEELLCNYLCEDFEDSGYETIRADNGLSGLEKVAEFAPDIVISDIKMPLCSGIEFVETVRRCTATWPPIVFLSGHGGVTEEEAFEMGAAGYFHKPCDQEKLVNYCAEVLDGIEQQALEGDVDQDFGDAKVRFGHQGIAIEGAHKSLSVGSDMSFSFRHDDALFRGTGRVMWNRWVEVNGQKPGVGIMLRSLEENGWNLYQEHVKKEQPVAFVPSESA